MSETVQFLSQAIALARENVRTGGRPFGAVVVKDGVVIANGVNETVATADPTAHAELMEVRVSPTFVKQLPSPGPKASG